MIDLRSHVLDGTPCGPGSFAESVEMCRAAAADGVTTLVATPRWEAGRAEPPIPFDECRSKIERLEAETGRAVALRLGFALQFSGKLPELVARHGPRLALAGKRHILVSLPSVEVPSEVEKVWGELSRAGFRVVLAHPECNMVLRRDAERLARWVAAGVTIQVDAASVAGAHGREVRRFALECLRRYEGRAVVASNARRGATQEGSLARSRRELAGIVGERRASGFTCGTPAGLIGESAARDGGRKSSLGLNSLFRSLGPIKALIGQP